jgi:phage-related minor tail protein
MKPTSSTPGLDVETRVQDYLNDKLQTTADLSNLDSLLQNIQQQHELLRVQVRLTSVASKACLLMDSKLEEANRILANAESASSQHDAELRQKAEQFNERQANIDIKLKDFTRSETSDEAIHKFELLMSKLQRLDVASGYLELLKEVDKLRFVAVFVHYVQDVK